MATRYIGSIRPWGRADGFFDSAIGSGCTGLSMNLGVRFSAVNDFPDRDLISPFCSDHGDPGGCCCSQAAVTPLRIVYRVGRRK